MLEPRLLRSDLEQVKRQLERRAYRLDTDHFTHLEGERKRLQVQAQTLQNERNTRSKAIGRAKAKGEDIAPYLQEVEDLGDRIKAIEHQLEAVQARLDDFLLGIPNLLAADVPDGRDEHDNIEVKRWGTPPQFDFVARDHVDLGERIGLMDFALGAKIAGARFVTLSGCLARLHRALIQFMLDVHTQEHGYLEVYVPYLCNEDSLRGTGQLPKFKQDLFCTGSEPPFYLIPTAEVPVTNFVRDEIIAAQRLPLRFVCHTPCFRSEAGSYGKDVRGMIRQHQFEKVELVQVTPPLASVEAHEELTRHAETILEKLQLPYRRVILCAGDTGFSSSKTYDLEVWLPGQQKYREISSCSNFGDFQARRLKARWRNPDRDKPELVHTLNGSGLAVGRTLIAIMENYQTAEGNIVIPEALRPYLHNQEFVA